PLFLFIQRTASVSIRRCPDRVARVHKSVGLLVFHFPLSRCVVPDATLRGRVAIEMQIPGKTAAESGR
ncbi:hypothetical protein CH063_14218, partial [Colletotrichum higginsianum]